MRARPVRPAALDLRLLGGPRPRQHGAKRLPRLRVRVGRRQLAVLRVPAAALALLPPRRAQRQRLRWRPALPCLRAAWTLRGPTASSSIRRLLTRRISTRRLGPHPPRRRHLRLCLTLPVLSRSGETCWTCLTPAGLTASRRTRDCCGRGRVAAPTRRRTGSRTCSRTPRPPTLSTAPVHPTHTPTGNTARLRTRRIRGRHCWGGRPERRRGTCRGRLMRPRVHASTPSCRSGGAREWRRVRAAAPRCGCRRCRRRG